MAKCIEDNCEKHVGQSGQRCQSCHFQRKREAGNKKICSVCQELKRHSGLGMCKTCYGKYKRSLPGWREKHAAYEKERRARLGDKYRAQERERNKTEKRQVWKRKYQPKYYEANRPQLLEYQKNWRRQDLARQASYKRRRLARVRGLEDTLTPQQWQDILAANNHSCFYCGVSGVFLEQEHKIPASRGGGLTAENIVPSCGPCNRRKKTMTAEEFAEYQTFLNQLS